jgi:hypothetical protein
MQAIIVNSLQKNKKKLAHGMELTEKSILSESSTSVSG